MHIKRLALAALALVAITVGQFLAVPSASASVSSSYCNGRSYKSVVKKYYRGSAAHPLRCGRSTWGFRHITSRWDAHFDSWIALTISRGAEVGDLQQDGGSNIYAIFDRNCHELFRVIYNRNAYLGRTDVRPQGVITAYYEGGAVPAVVGRAGTIRAYTPPPPSSGSTRSNCLVIQNI
jgi:hypothetical protein